MFWITIMFIASVVGMTVVAVAWVERDKPPEPDYEPVPLGNLDGFELCRGCRHPKVASHTIRRVIIEDHL